ncbi:MAG: hypothetical protein QXX12_06525 [Nanopusillaceae archaeon]
MSWSERVGAFFNTPLGRLVRGVIKLSLAGFLIVLVTQLTNALPDDPDIGGATVPVRTIMTVIISLFPLLYMISAFRDLGVDI